MIEPGWVLECKRSRYNRRPRKGAGAVTIEHSLVDHAVRHDDAVVVAGRGEERVAPVEGHRAHGAAVQAQRLVRLRRQLQVEPAHGTFRTLLTAPHDPPLHLSCANILFILQRWRSLN